MGLKVYILIVLVSLFAVFIQHSVRVIYFMGYHITVYNHTPGPCRKVPGMDQGAEDMETLPNGLTFITSGFLWRLSSDKFKKYYKDTGRKGKIMLFDLNEPDKGVTELVFDEEFDQSTFYPHGISVIQNNATGKVTLFVVNHYPGADKIEKFEYVPDKLMLKHIYSYMDSQLHMVNDVAATSENSFYFTNFVHSQDHFRMSLEVLLFLPFGNVVYFDGSKYEVVADSFVMANGIVVSKDHKNVYVVNGLFSEIRVFQTEENGSLTLVQEYPLGLSPDNLLIEPKTGNLLTGVHPVLHLTSVHQNDVSQKAPSKVFMINMANGSYADGITELFSDDGNLISGSTIATIHDNKMLIGSIVDTLVYCEVRNL